MQLTVKLLVLLLLVVDGAGGDAVGSVIGVSSCRLRLWGAGGGLVVLV